MGRIGRIDRDTRDVPVRETGGDWSEGHAAIPRDVHHAVGRADVNGPRITLRDRDCRYLAASFG